MKDINRIKVVLAEKKKTNKWLAEQLGMNPSTVSKWCCNHAQPDLYTLTEIIIDKYNCNNIKWMWNKNR